MMVIVFHVVMLVGGLIAFFHHQNKLRTRAHLMREAALNRDFTFRLPVNGLFYGEKRGGVVAKTNKGAYA